MDDGFEKNTPLPILRESNAMETVIKTDAATLHKCQSDDYADYDFATYGKGEDVQCEAPQFHTNTVAGFNSSFNRGMKGVYPHCGKQHLRRDVAGVDFRYDSRIASGSLGARRGAIVLRSAAGKRLTYKCGPCS